jgi:hypothetical protein
METLRLLKDLENLIMSQKTLLGVTHGFHQEDFLDLTNKIRASLLPAAVAAERNMEKTEIILARHLHSQEDVAAIMNEIRAGATI